MQHLLGGLLLLLGVGAGFALAKRRRAAFGLLVLAGVGVGLVPFFIPRVQFETACQIRGRLWTDDEHPYELVGAWVGWDTRHTHPYCRLELDENGTGRGTFWHGTSFGGYSERKPTEVLRVTRWRFSSDRLEIQLESEKGEKRMRGDAYSDLLLLEYTWGNPEADHNWLGTLRLVRADAEDAARRDVAAVTGER